MTLGEKTLTILYMLPELNIGGVETHVASLAEGMSKIGHKVIIVSNGGAMVSGLEEKGLEHITLPVHKKSLLTIREMATRVRKLAEDRGVDVVHAHSRVPAWIARFGVAGGRSAFIITAHGQYAPHMGSKVMSMGDRIVCVSQGIKDHLQQKLKADPKRMHVVYNGVDIEHADMRLGKRRAAEEIKKELGFAPEAPMIGSIGRLTSTKGHHYFIEAFLSLKEKRPDLKGVIVGDGPMRKELQDKIDEFKLTGELVLTGVRTDVHNIFGAMDVYVVASIFEGFPMGCLEALSSRVPIVATKVGGIPEMLEDGRTALLVEPKNAPALAGRIEKMLAEPELGKRLAEAGRADLVEKFSEKNMIQELLDLYYETLRSKNGYIPPVKGVSVNTKPRVMITLPELQVGGVETHVIDLSVGLKKRGFEPVVVSFGGKMVERLEKEGVEHICLPVHLKSPATMLSMVFRIRKLLEEREIDIAHAHSRVPAWIIYFALIRRRDKITFMTTCHSTYGVHIGSWVMTMSDRAMSVSAHVRNHMIEKFRMNPKKNFVVRNGVHADAYDSARAVEMNERYRKELGIPMDYKVVGMVASLTPRKGYIYFIKAAEITLRKHKNVMFLAVGEGRQRQELEEIVKEHGLENNFKFLGMRPDVQSLMSCFDIFTLPSLSEGAPYVILEAMCFCKPIIASAVAGIPEAIKHGESGMLIKAADFETLAEYMRELIEDPELASRLGAMGRKAVEDVFNVNTMVDSVVSHYYEALN